MHRYETLFFDLDGTLARSDPGIIAGLRFALENMGVFLDEGVDLSWCIGPSLLETFVHFLGDEDKAHAAIAHYRTYYRSQGVLEASLYPGIEEVLKALTQAGRTLAVVTSKPTVFARKMVFHLGILGYFEEIYGSTLDGRYTDKAQLLGFVLGTGAFEAPCVMIGDRKYDILGARAHGLDCIGATWGYGTKDELEAAGPTHLCSSPIGLLSQVG